MTEGLRRITSLGPSTRMRTDRLISSASSQALLSVELQSAVESFHEVDLLRLASAAIRRFPLAWIPTEEKPVNNLRWAVPT